MLLNHVKLISRRILTSLPICRITDEVDIEEPKLDTGGKSIMYTIKLNVTHIHIA